MRRWKSKIGWCPGSPCRLCLLESCWILDLDFPKDTNVCSIWIVSNASSWLMKHQSNEWSLRNERQKWDECFWRGGTKRIAFLSLMIREMPASLYCTESQSINGKEIIYDTGEKWTKSWDNILEHNLRGRIDVQEKVQVFAYIFFFK